MKKWKISEAKARFSEVLGACKKEAQIICYREKPVGALISTEEYERLMAAKDKAEVPVIPKLLEELRAIQAMESEEIFVPPREDRKNALIEASHELSD